MLRNYACQKGTVIVNSGSKAELKATDEKQCIPLDSIRSGYSSKLLDCLVTHKWETKSSQDSQIMGMVIALKCSRCSIEWLSIISKGRVQ